MGPEWIHEIERDGYHLVQREGKIVRLWTRNLDWKVAGERTLLIMQLNRRSASCA